MQHRVGSIARRRRYCEECWNNAVWIRIQAKKSQVDENALGRLPRGLEGLEPWIDGHGTHTRQSPNLEQPILTRGTAASRYVRGGILSY